MRLGAAVLLCLGVLQAQPPLPDMLDKAMPAVVTVTVGVAEDGRLEAAGFTASDSAYAKTLLSDPATGTTGSGFVIESGGKKYVVTNAHVVEADPGSAVVYSFDRKRYPMKLAGLDTLYDIAVLSFAEGGPGAEIGAVEFRTADIRLGESVYAVGNPRGRFPNSVVSGIVGGLNRRSPDLTGRFGYLQSTATVIWGNSGGPLLDAFGRVAGINTKAGFEYGEGALADKVMQHPQINLALDGKIAARVVKEILEGGGRLKRAYFGMQFGADWPKDSPVVRATATYLEAVVPGSPAAALSPKIGWRVVRAGDIDVETPDDVLEALEKVRPGGSLELELVHPKTNKAEVVKLTAGELTDANSSSLARFVFTNCGLETKESNGAVLLVKKPDSAACPQLAAREAAAMAGRPRAGASARPDAAKPLPNPLRIIAAGVDQNQMYRVRNARDLGVACKIAAASGSIEFYHEAEAGHRPAAYYLTFPASANAANGYVRRVILY